MGYAYYDTLLGPAGYGVDDVCHEQGCAAQIDRGLEHLCGSDPGYEHGEVGCGRWYCGEHLDVAPTSVEIIGGGLCSRCLASWERENPELVAAEEEEFQRRCTQLRTNPSGSVQP